MTSDQQVDAGLCAGIDVGTNSVKMVIGDLSGGGASRVYESSLVTRLGEGMQAQAHRLREAAMRRTHCEIDAGKLEAVEINEAFAAVAITSTRMLEVDPDRVNVNGGAIAVGHPIGASGARILMTLLYELRRRGGGYGAAGICSGIAQGEATLVRVD